MSVLKPLGWLLEKLTVPFKFLTRCSIPLRPLEATILLASKPLLLKLKIKV